MDIIRPDNTPYAAWQPRQARVYLKRSVPWVTWGALGLSVLLWLVDQALQALLGDPLITRWLMKVPAVYIVHTGQWWRLWTPVLVHANLIHLGLNMYALYLFGPTLEDLLGHRRFLALYLTGGLWGNALSAIFTPYGSVGASSALFGLMVGLLVLVQRHRPLMGLWGQRLYQNLLGLLALNALVSFLPQVDLWGHLGGALGGLLFILVGGPRWKLQPYPIEALSEQEKAAFFLKRIMPLQLHDEHSPARWHTTVAVMWLVAVLAVYAVGR